MADVHEIVGTLGAAWKRQFIAFSDGPPAIFCMYLEEALTGFACIIANPVIEEFKNEKCVAIPLASWVMIKTIATETVTPFRIVAQGTNIISKAFMPHTGLKFPVRNTSLGAALLIPVVDFKKV